jgi:hypothetical protein
VSRPIFKLLFVALITIFTNCEKQNIQSNWATVPVTIDGKPLEWQKCLSNLQDTTVIAGALNDTGFIYLCIISRNVDLNMLAAGPGLMLWFEHKELKSGRVGIRFSSNKNMMHHHPHHDEVHTGKENEFYPHEHQLSPEIQTIELFSSGGDSTVITETIAIRYGIQAEIAFIDGQMVCEIKLPLHDNDSSVFSLGIVNDILMSVTVETAAVKMHERGVGRPLQSDGPHHGGREGGHGGEMGLSQGGGMRPDNRGGGHGGNHPLQGENDKQMLNPIKIDFMVKLALKS